MSGGLPFPVVQLRLRQAREIADARGSMEAVAAKWGIGMPTARIWLREQDAALYKRFGRKRSGPKPPSDADVLEQLRFIRDSQAKGRMGKQIAHDLGFLHASGVAEFVSRYAPDGLDATIRRLQRHLAKHNKAA